MAEEKKNSPIELSCQRFHENGEKVRAKISRLDTSDEIYSDDFELLYTAIAGTNIDSKRIEEAQLELKRRHGKLPKSDAFKTALSNFISITKLIYKNQATIDAARDCLKKNGWLPKPAAPKPQPKPFDQPKPQPIRPTDGDGGRKPVNPNPFDGWQKPQPIRPTGGGGGKPFPDPVRPQPRRPRAKASFTERVDDWFDTIQTYLDIWLDYISQYAETVFYILGGLVGAAIVILTFISGHWIIAIIEIVIFAYVGLYALAIGGALAKLVLKTAVYALKLIFRAWWTFLIFIILAVGVPTATSLWNNSKEKQFRAHVEKALTAAEEERFLDAQEHMLKAAEYNEKKAKELKNEAAKMPAQAAKKASALKKSIPQEIAKLKKQKKSESGFVDEVEAIQEKIDLLRCNEKPSSSADKFQKQLDELKKKKIK